MTQLMNFYIVDRKSGKTYEPDMILNGSHLLAYSNIATDRNPFTIYIKKLITGLAERRYRLVPKTI